MSYTWLKFGQGNSPNVTSYTALGVGWVAQPALYYPPTHTQTFSGMGIGEVLGGGAWVLHRVATNSYLPFLVTHPSRNGQRSTASSGLMYLVQTAQLSNLGIPVNSAYRLEWRFRKLSDVVLGVEVWVNGTVVTNTSVTILPAYRDHYVQIQYGIPDNSVTFRTWHREMYVCEDDPIFGYWEFRTVPVTALPNQKLTTSQVRNGWTSDEGFSQLVTIDKSAIPEDNTVLAYITDHQLYAKKRSPRQSEQSFSTELHGTKSQTRNVSLLNANTSPAAQSYRHYDATELEQPTLARDLDPTLRFDYQFTIEE